eukprot:scaffold5744_cov179-Ochromonas_danica.AAC.3
MRLTITQNIQPYEQDTTSTRFGGDFINTLHYYYYLPVQEKVYEGKFEVHGSFNYNPRGDLMTSLTEHVLLPNESPRDGISMSDPIVPPDMDDFFLGIQRGVPRHVFDPSNYSTRLLYIDPELRIERVYSDLPGVDKTIGQNLFKALRPAQHFRVFIL